MQTYNITHRRNRKHFWVEAMMLATRAGDDGGTAHRNHEEEQGL